MATIDEIRNQATIAAFELQQLNQLLKDFNPTATEGNTKRRFRVTAPTGEQFESLSAAGRWALCEVESLKKMAEVKRDFDKISEQSILAIARRHITEWAERPETGWTIEG